MYIVVIYNKEKELVFSNNCKIHLMIWFNDTLLKETNQ